MFQLYELCRLCAQKKRHKLDLFTGLREEEDKILLAKISLCLSVNVTREDLLPKIICLDCQRAVEQFNAFRIKCRKAEDRLNKMLSLVPPSKLNVTRIKEECSEPDVHDFTTIQMKTDLPVLSETLQFINFKPVKNIKSEVDDNLDNVGNWNLTNGEESSDLIKIISEEMVSQQRLDDTKETHIEIISSEDFNEEYKNINYNENGHFYTCDIKIIPETLIRADEEMNIPDYHVNQEDHEMSIRADEEMNVPNYHVNQKDHEMSSTVLTEVKETMTETDQNMSQNVSRKQKLRSAKPRRKRKIRPSVASTDETDEKYLTLREGEVCDIDLEEMSALIKKKQDPNALFSCNVCNRSFKLFKCFQKHKQWHKSQPEVFFCDFCENVNSPYSEFYSFKSLNRHIKRKHLLPYSKCECQLCHKIFASQGQLNVHFKKVHDESGATCQDCGKRFKNKTCLYSHMKVHKNERPFVCDKCGDSFKWSNGLKVHMMWHRQEKNFLCSECGQKFTTKKNLMEHLNLHTGKRPYVCDNCDASFAQFSAFSKHIYLHNENSRIHKCDKCEKTFSHTYALKLHLVRHTSLRPFKCSTCDRSFKSQSDLCGHVKIHQEKKYCCQVCGMKFAVSKTLRDHMVRHTGIKHICPVPGCGKTYTQRFSLTKHFSKKHSSFSIVRKKSGKRSHLLGGKQSPKPDFIRYDFKEKDSGDPTTSGRMVSVSQIPSKRGKASSRLEIIDWGNFPTSLLETPHKSR